MPNNNTRESRHLTPEERIALQAEEIKQLQQENEQLRAQVEQVREVLHKANARDKATWFECTRCGSIHDTLTTIIKIIGGAENGSSTDK